MIVTLGAGLGLLIGWGCEALLASIAVEPHFSILDAFLIEDPLEPSSRRFL